jgi:hypothetical protein
MRNKAAVIDETEVAFVLRCFSQLSDQMALNGVRHCLKPIVRSEFLIDVVEMIAQCLWTDTERLRDTWCILSCCKHPQNLQLMTRSVSE